MYCAFVSQQALTRSLAASNNPSQNPRNQSSVTKKESIPDSISSIHSSVRLGHKAREIAILIFGLVIPIYNLINTNDSPIYISFSNDALCMGSCAVARVPGSFSA